MNKLVYATIFFLTLACSASDDKLCPDKSCDDYASQADAQAAFNANKDCLGELDHDSDGIACEQTWGVGGGSGSGGGTGCPTTANCGCSNKTKDQCASACCKWIVGTGCRCS